MRKSTMCDQLRLLAVLLLLLSCCSLCIGLTLRPMPQLDGRIVGGYETNIEAIPFQVSLQQTTHFCGGSLIGKSMVLTAAHCAEGWGIMSSKVRIGATRWDSGGLLVAIRRAHLHPKYNRLTIDYDFAVLELEQYDEANITHSYVQLPMQNADVADGTVLVVSGWGNTKSNAETKDVLRAVAVPKVSQALCQAAYGLYSNITERMMCAGFREGGKDSCQGDSGGPLAANGTLWGVVSWGFGCAEPNAPGVYSRVASVRNWIKSVTGI